MDIRQIDNDDLMALLELTIGMYKHIEPTINQFGAINTVTHEIGTKPNFIAIGLYDDNDKLVGFTKGYSISNKMFYFSGIHVIMKNNEWTKKLIDYSFKLISDLGYSAWSVDATNSNISSIMEKYGAVPKFTRYVKEMD